MATTVTFTVTGNTTIALPGGAVYTQGDTFQFTKQQLQDLIDIRKALVNFMTNGLVTAAIGETSVNADFIANIDEGTEGVAFNELDSRVDDLEAEYDTLDGRVSVLESMAVVKEGTVTISGTDTSATVTFNPQLTYDYVPVAVVYGNATIYVTSIKNVSRGGFTVEISGAPGEGNSVDIYYALIKKPAA